MPKFTVRFQTPAAFAETEITAATPDKALARARLLARDPHNLDFERFNHLMPVEEIEVLGDGGDGLARWISPSLRLQLSAPALLEAAQQVVARWETGDLAEAVRELAAAIDEAGDQG